MYWQRPNSPLSWRDKEAGSGSVGNRKGGLLSGEGSAAYYAGQYRVSAHRNEHAQGFILVSPFISCVAGAATMSRLKRTLFDEYNGFADKRIKRLDRGSTFIVDDRAESDVGADRHLLSYFCMIFAEVLSATEVKVSLCGNVPIGEGVRRWISSHACEMHAVGVQQSLSFMVAEGRQDSLGELANAIETVVAPSAPRYEVKSYKYVCPRTARSLRRLERTLDTAWAK